MVLGNIEDAMHHEWKASAERLYANAPIGICYFDRELRYRYVNNWLARLNGFSVGQHLGKTIDDISKSFAAAAVPQLLQVIDSGEAIIDAKEFRSTTGSFEAMTRSVQYTVEPRWFSMETENRFSLTVRRKILPTEFG